MCARALRVPYLARKMGVVSLPALSPSHRAFHVDLATLLPAT